MSGIFCRGDPPARLQLDPCPSPALTRSQLEGENSKLVAKLVQSYGMIRVYQKRLKELGTFPGFADRPCPPAVPPVPRTAFTMQSETRRASLGSWLGCNRRYRGWQSTQQTQRRLLPRAPPKRRRALPCSRGRQRRGHHLPAEAFNLTGHLSRSSRCSSSSRRFPASLLRHAISRYLVGAICPLHRHLHRPRQWHPSSGISPLACSLPRLEWLRDRCRPRPGCGPRLGSTQQNHPGGRRRSRGRPRRHRTGKNPPSRPAP